MISSRLPRRWGMIILAATTVIAGTICGARPASATSVLIDNWYFDQSTPCYTETHDMFCFWYSQKLSNGVWGTNLSVPTITGTFVNGGVGTGGVGQQVRNNAASMEDDSNCFMYAYVYPNYVGDSNEVDPAFGGNLTSSPLLRNNEASMHGICP